MGIQILEKLLGSLYASIQKEVAGGEGGKGSVQADQQER